MDEEEYNQFDEVPCFIDPTKSPLIESELTFTGLMPYLRLNGEGKTVQG